MEFRISLKAARINRELTQEDAAKALGINPLTLIRYENGTTQKIPYNMVVKMSELYQVPIDNIFLPNA